METPHLNAFLCDKPCCADKTAKCRSELSALKAEIATLRAKAKLADEYARDLIALREEDGDLFGVEATNGESIIGIETRAVVDWLQRYAALDARNLK